MKGKATRGRKRMQLMSDIMKNRSYKEVKREAEDGGGWTAKMLQTCWQLVSWSLTSLFSTNMAISEMKGQGWKVIRTQ